MISGPTPAGSPMVMARWGFMLPLRQGPRSVRDELFQEVGTAEGPGFGDDGDTVPAPAAQDRAGHAGHDVADDVEAVGTERLAEATKRLAAAATSVPGRPSVARRSAKRLSIMAAAARRDVPAGRSTLTKTAPSAARRRPRSAPKPDASSRRWSGPRRASCVRMTLCSSRSARESAGARLRHPPRLQPRPHAPGGGEPGAADP